MARPSKNNPTGAQKSSKHTPEVIAKLEQAFSIDASIGEACFFADVSVASYHNWCSKDPKLMERFKALRNKPVLLARKTVVDNLKDVSTAKWYLERKLSAEFSTQNDLGIKPESGIGLIVNMPVGYNGPKPDTTAG
jgi:hypothetical protein